MDIQTQTRRRGVEMCGIDRKACMQRACWHVLRWQSKCVDGKSVSSVGSIYQYINTCLFSSFICDIFVFMKNPDPTPAHIQGREQTFMKTSDVVPRKGPTSFYTPQLQIYQNPV